MLHELGAGEDELTVLHEVILIRNGRYCGRSYRAAGLLAMWLVEVGILQFYGPEGEMLRTVNLFEEMSAVRQAA